LNGIGLAASTCLYNPVANNLNVLAQGTQVQKAAEPFNQPSDGIGTGSIGIHQMRGIEWYSFHSVRQAIEVSTMKKADISRGRCPPEWGIVSLESAH